MPKDPAWMPNIGLIGTEHMSAPIVARLVDAKYIVSMYAKKQQAGVTNVAKAGASSSGSISQVLQKNDLILLCLPRSEAAVNVIEKDLNPILLKEKIIVDLGTTDLNETRRLSKFLKLRNAHFLDAPVTGGPRDVEKGRASMFCGGKREVFERCLKTFKVITGLGSVTFCGAAGSGQIVKAVYDMSVGLTRAAILESIAFGMGQGMQREQLWEALEHTLPQNIDIERIMAVMAMKGGGGLVQRARAAVLRERRARSGNRGAANECAGEFR